MFRAGRYWVPQWYKPDHRLAYWDLFSRPDKLPRYAIYDYAIRRRRADLWWFDAAKAAKLEQAK